MVLFFTFVDDVRGWLGQVRAVYIFVSRLLFKWAFLRAFLLSFRGLVSRYRVLSVRRGDGA